MKITIKQLKELIREQVETNLEDSKDSKVNDFKEKLLALVNSEGAELAKLGLLTTIGDDFFMELAKVIRKAKAVGAASRRSPESKTASGLKASETRKTNKASGDDLLRRLQKDKQLEDERIASGKLPKNLNNIPKAHAHYYDAGTDPKGGYDTYTLKPKYYDLKIDDIKLDRGR